MRTATSWKYASGAWTARPSCERLGGAVDNRDRYLRTLRFETVDHPPILNSAPWPATLNRWHQEGLPENCSLDEYFGVEPLRLRAVGIETLWFPPFEEKVLEEDGEFVIKINSRGVKERNFRDGRSMPEFIEYPIKGPADWEWMDERLDPDAPGRVQPDWEALARGARERGDIVFCNGGMYFAFLNEHMGTERLLYLYYDEPDFIHRVNDRLCSLCERALSMSLAKKAIDYVGYHEDMAFKNGPLISPDMFTEFMMPYYRRIKKVCGSHGMDIHCMDSDGDIRQLIPLWLECGINVFAPLEAAAGMDPVRLRAEYGRQVRMIGGFDKRILAGSPEGIRRELERLRPVIEEGGYIPGCDHSIPPDVPFGNYATFMLGLKTICGVS